MGAPVSLTLGEGTYDLNQSRTTRKNGKWDRVLVKDRYPERLDGLPELLKHSGHTDDCPGRGAHVRSDHHPLQIREAGLNRPSFGSIVLDAVDWIGHGIDQPPASSFEFG